MKITKRQIRRIIRESMASDRIYLDDFTSGLFDLRYDNSGDEWIILQKDFQRLKGMSQYDAAHQKIFAKYESRPETVAVGVGYGWWELK